MKAVDKCKNCKKKKYQFSAVKKEKKNKINTEVKMKIEVEAKHWQKHDVLEKGYERAYLLKVVSKFFIVF